MSQRSFAWWNSLLVLMTVCLACATGTEPVTPLKETFQGKFDIGVALGGKLPDDFTPAEIALWKHFSIVTPENCMKLNHVQRREGEFNFKQADAFMSAAEANHFKVVGHNLVWVRDDETPAWLFKDGDQPASRELLLKRLKTHIDAVAGRYRGKIDSWDVANETLGDGKEYMRPSKWQSLGGEDIVQQMFRFAHEADPQAKLVYNDYSIESAGKRAKLLRMLKEFKANNVPIDVIGIQGHWELDFIPFKEIEETIVAVHELGLKVAITELDLDVMHRGRFWADGGKYEEEMKKLNPYADGCPAEVLQRQADQYAQLFRLFTKHADTVTRVTFWGLHDGRSWLNSWPWKRVNHPLLFSRQCEPKPAFFAVSATAKQ